MISDLKVLNRDIPKIKNGRTLVWHDEFDESTVNADKWSMIRSMNCVGQIYDNSEKHIRIENNNLLMQIHKCGDTFSLCEGLTTKSAMNFKYGYLEMRAKIPYRHCAWPSFWLLGNTCFHNESEKWFAEIDIFEVFSSVDSAGPNLHKWGSGEHEMLPGDENNPYRAYKFENPETLNDEFHIYGFSWDEHEMGFYIDDNCYFKVTIDDSSNFKSELFPTISGFHEPVYILLNNEMFTEKSDWLPEGFAVTPDDPMPIDYYVDWIRLYQNSETDVLILKDEIKAVIKE